MKIEEFYEERAQAKNPQTEIMRLEDDRWIKIKRCVDKWGKVTFPHFPTTMN